MTAITATTAENLAVREAKDLPDLVNKLEVVSPALAAQLVGKTLAASRTPWGTVLVPAVAWVAMRYGLGWTAEIDTAVAGALVLICSFVMRYLTSVPITSLFHKAKPVAAVAVMLPFLMLASCAGTTTAAVTATISQAQSHLEAAITLYGVAKGIGQVAVLADPGFAVVLTPAVAVLDPLVAKARATLAAATMDAVAIEALAAAINAQAVALTIQAAPVVKVVPAA